MYKILGIVAGLVLVACTDQDSIAKYEAAIARVGAIEKTSREKMEELERKIEELGDRIFDLEFSSSYRESVTLKPAHSGYGLAKCDLGVLTFMIGDVSQFANSIKIRLRIGNPLDAALDDVEGNYEWGSISKKEGRERRDKIGSKKITLNEKILAGSWTTATIILEGVEVKDFGYLKISDLSCPSIILKKAVN